MIDIGGVSPSELHTPKLVTFTESNYIYKNYFRRYWWICVDIGLKTTKYCGICPIMIMQCLKHPVRYAQLPLTPTLSVFRSLREDYHWPDDQWLCWYSIIVGCYHELRYSTPYVGMAGCYMAATLTVHKRHVLENFSNAFMRHIKCFPDQQHHERPWRASVKYQTGKSLKRAKSCSSFFSHGNTKMAEVTIIGTWKQPILKVLHSPHTIFKKLEIFDEQIVADIKYVNTAKAKVRHYNVKRRGKMCMLPR